MASSVGTFPFPNPEGGPDLQLRVRRDLSLSSRKLFYYLGNMRQRVRVSSIFGADKVGSTGLGGTVYMMKDNGVPVQVVKISVVDDGPTAGTVQCGVEID
eukprot:1779075-Pyramimonas_sp.AAC.1